MIQKIPIQDFILAGLIGKTNQWIESIVKIIANTKFTIKNNYCHFKSVRYATKIPVIWEFAMLFSENTGKACLISCWLVEGEESPIYTLLESIKFV